MATEAEVVDIVFRPLLKLYRPPAGMDEPERVEALRATMLRSLMPFPASVLQRGWDRVVTRHYGWEWPTVQEIVRECHLCS